MRIRHLLSMAILSCTFIVNCSSPEEDAFDEAKEQAEKENSFSSYEAFLKKYDKGKYADEARDSIRVIQRRLELARQLAQETADYKEALNQGTAEALASFLQDYPNGEHAYMAEAKIEGLKRESILNNTSFEFYWHTVPVSDVMGKGTLKEMIFKDIADYPYYMYASFRVHNRSKFTFKDFKVTFDLYSDGDTYRQTIESDVIYKLVPAGQSVQTETVGIGAIKSGVAKPKGKITDFVPVK